MNEFYRNLAPRSRDFATDPSRSERQRNALEDEIADLEIERRILLIRLRRNARRLAATRQRTRPRPTPQQPFPPPPPLTYESWLAGLSVPYKEVRP